MDEQTIKLHSANKSGDGNLKAVKALVLIVQKLDYSYEKALVLFLASGAKINIPFDLLSKYFREEVKPNYTVEITGNGKELYWPGLDVFLSVSTISRIALFGKDYKEPIKSKYNFPLITSAWISNDNWLCVNLSVPDSSLEVPLFAIDKLHGTGFTVDKLRDLIWVDRDVNVVYFGDLDVSLTINELVNLHKDFQEFVEWRKNKNSFVPPEDVKT